MPLEIVSNWGFHFVNEIIEFMMSEFIMSHKKITPYHPQANGQEKSTNKKLCIVLMKVVSESQID